MRSPFKYSGFCRIPGVLSAHAARRALEEAINVALPPSRLAVGNREPDAPQP